MGLINRLASALNIRPGEGRLVNLLLLHSFFVGVNRVFLLSASTSLFLTEFGANTLPYVYIATAVANSSVGFLYNWLGKRISFVKLLVANLVFQFLLVTGFWLLFGLTDAQWPAIAFMVSIELLWLLTNLEFWSLSVRIFNIQQGKRLFGVIGSGDTIASIIGGFTVPVIVGLIGTRNLLLLVIASIIASLVVILVIARLFGDRLSAQYESLKNPEVTERYTNPLKNRYIVLIFAFACVATISYYFLDNAFYGLTEIHYPQSDSLAGFLGVYFAIMALVQLIVQTFFNARIINRLGIAVCIILVPLLGTLMMGATAIVALLAGTASITFIFMGVVRLVEYVLRGTITSSSQMTIYQSLPPTIRVQTQTQVESFVEPITTGAAGILLLLILDVLKWSMTYLIVASVVVGLIWTIVSVLLSREYPKALLQALSKRRLGNIQFLSKDQSVSALVKERLAASNAGDALYLLNLLEETDLPALQLLLPDALNHPAPEVRQDVLRRIEKLKLVTARSAVRKMLTSEANPAVRAAAIQVAIIIDPDFILKQASALLDSDEMPIRVAAIAGLIRGQNPDGAALAESRLRMLLNSNDPQERVLAAQAVGEIGLQPLYQPLLRLLQDEDMDVRRAAITAAGQLHSPQLWPALIENLSVKAVRSVGISALSSADDSVVPFLAAALIDIRNEFEASVHTHLSVAQQIIRICSRLRNTTPLEPHIDFPDTVIREQILSTLAQLKYHTDDTEKIEVCIRQEIQDDLWYLQGLALLQDDPLLPDTLDYFLKRLRERVFLLCAFIYDAQAVMRARSDYYSDSEIQRSYALEMLHVTLSRELRLSVIALLDDDIESRQGMDALIEIFEQTWLDRRQWLEKVLTSRDSSPWLKVSALYGIRRRNQRNVIRAVEKVSGDSSPVVRETAEWTLDRIDDRTLRREKMLLTIEKMLLLKSVSLFSHVPDPILFEIASIVKDETVLEGKTILQKGDLGDCMYIIASGRVRIHDGEQTIAWMGEKDVFGELALLDSEPRNASVTAVEETYLLRLDQNTFYELISDYPEVLRGIIRVLSQRLRETTRRSMMPQPPKEIASA